MYDREIAINLLKRVKEATTEDEAIEHVLDMLQTAAESAARAVDRDYYTEYHTETISVPVLQDMSEMAMADHPYIQKLANMGKKGWQLVYRDPKASGLCVHTFARKVK